MQLTWEILEKLITETISEKYENVGEVEGYDIEDKQLVNEEELEEISYIPDVTPEQDEPKGYPDIYTSKEFTPKDIRRILHIKNRNPKDLKIRVTGNLTIDDGSEHGKELDFEVPKDLYYTGFDTHGYPCCVLYERYDESIRFHWYDKKFDKVVMSVYTWKPLKARKNSNLRVVDWAVAAKKIRGKGIAYDCYKTLVTKLNIVLMSDRTQSKGSKYVWEKFISDKDLIALVQYDSEKTDRYGDSKGYEYSPIEIDQEGNIHSAIGDPWVEEAEVDAYKKDIHGLEPERFVWKAKSEMTDEEKEQLKIRRRTERVWTISNRLSPSGGRMYYKKNPELEKYQNRLQKDKELQAMFRAEKSTLFIYSRRHKKGQIKIPPVKPDPYVIVRRLMNKYSDHERNF